ncbi:MAG: GTP 3',8-cyclase MoaA [Acidobacteriota bacterium]|nr:GTP 3',8-cyclase MoaA [Acidobacteriota bacterium]
MKLHDIFQRPLRDLRISVTDHCNFRCGYCMPADRTYTFLPKSQVLTLEEIAELAGIFAAHGTRKLRITGGEPLLRRGLVDLIAMLSSIPGIEDIALTTNGFALKRLAAPLKEAGLNRVTVSLDSLDPAVFAELSGTKIATPASTLAAIDHAASVGLPVKINTVVQRGVNDNEIISLLETFRERGHTLRFIEFMDVGSLNRWDRTRVVPAVEIRERVAEVFPFEPVEPAYHGEVAGRFRFLDGKGEFGIISSVTQPFCGSCNRARLSAEGKLYTCLFAKDGHDLKTLLREQGPQAVADSLRRVWRARDDRYSELRGREDQPKEKVEMFHIGG